MTKIMTAILVSFCLWGNYAHANLLISPTRVAFDERARSATVYLVNTGNTTKSYRLDWIEQQTDINGQYSEISPQQVSRFPKASPYVRLAPRQVKLKAGERQAIKLMVRRPKNFAEGEYRSHLKFTALPSQTAKDTDAIGIKLNLLMSYSIPVLIREGEGAVSANIKDVKFIPKGNQKLDIALQLQRQGKYSLAGNITAYYQPPGGKERVVGRLNSVQIYTEQTQRNVQFEWLDFQQESGGKLKIVYQGIDEYRSQVFTQRSFSLNN